MMPTYFVHESSIVEPGAQIGAGTKIWHFCHVMGTARIGGDCVLGQNVFVGDRVVVGTNVKIQNNVSIYPGVTIEDDVFLGPSMVFTNVNNPRSEVNRKAEFQPTLVRRGASIGANATIVCGVTLGSYCFVGAGAVVTADIPDYALAFGNPARIRGWMCQCGSRLDFLPADDDQRALCGACGRTYAMSDQVVTLMDPNERPTR